MARADRPDFSDERAVTMRDDENQPHDEFAFAEGTATARVILPPIADWTGPSERHIAAPADDWIIKAEQSGFRETADSAETRSWLERLAAGSESMSLQSIGLSAGRRDIPMMVVSRFGFDPLAVRETGKAVVLIQAGIHAGEIDGKDATMMLLRDLAAGRLGDLLDHIVLLFVPVLNVDGFSRFGPHARMNQRGPRQVGRHTNDQNLNLNRDFGKLDAPETRALVAVLNAWLPDLYIDTHVTDGVDYRYDVTFGHTAGRHGWSPEISSWLDEHLLPDAVAALEKEGHTPGPLILSVNDRDLTEGRFDFCANARFATGYASLRHMPAILIENHSLKTYRQRVLGLYVLLRSLLAGASRKVDGLRAAVKKDREARRAWVPLGWAVACEDRHLAPFKGIRSIPAASALSGEKVAGWTGEADDSPVAIVPMTAPSAAVRRPRAYYIPPHLADIVERLTLHGIVLEEVPAALTLRVTRTYLDEAKVVGGRPEAGIIGTSTSAVLEGHVRVDAGKLRQGVATVTIPAGAARVSVDQALGDLAIVLLEAASADSFFQWGFMLSIFDDAAHQEPYVLDPLGDRMLHSSAALLHAFETKLATDAAFAGSAERRRAWLLERTPYADADYRLYPILREELDFAG
jgi:hypothetical protein